MWKCKGPGTAQPLKKPLKKNKVGETTLPDFEIYYQVTVYKKNIVVLAPTQTNRSQEQKRV